MTSVISQRMILIYSDRSTLNIDITSVIRESRNSLFDFCGVDKYKKKKSVHWLYKKSLQNRHKKTNKQLTFV